MKRLVIIVLVFLAFSVNEALATRIVVLYAAASPVLKALGIEEEVVGVTRRDRNFPHAVKVGSHLRPNVELVKALRPDLIIAGSKRAFPEELRAKVKAEVFYYDPRTLEEIIETILQLGRRLGREEQARSLVRKLRAKLSEIKPLPCRPKIVYEIMERPLRVAGQKNIVTDIIRVAGGVNPVKVPRKHVLISPEEILLLSPDLYLYQVGPMNKNPTPPQERAYFKGLKARVERVDEFLFSRPGPNAFQAAVELNRMLGELCAEGSK